MSILDSLLGLILSSSVEIPLGSGLNFKSGLRAAFNVATKLIDVTLTNAPYAVASQEGWDGAVETADTLEVVPAGHDPGFYLVGAQVTFTAGTGITGNAVPAFYWQEGAEEGSVIGAALTTGTIRTAAPQLVYSDGTAAIEVVFGGTIAGTGVAITARANALRVSA